MQKYFTFLSKSVSLRKRESNQGKWQRLLKSADNKRRPCLGLLERQ